MSDNRKRPGLADHLRQFPGGVDIERNPLPSRDVLDDAAIEPGIEIQSRIDRVFKMCMSVYRDEDRAREFLGRRHMMLDNKTPLEVASESDAGADRVINLIGRAAYGGAV